MSFRFTSSCRGTT